MDLLISKYILYLGRKDLTFMVSAETNLLLTWGWLVVIGCTHSRHVCAPMMETCSRLMSRFINSFSVYLWSGPLVCLLLPGLIFGFSLPPCGFCGIYFCVLPNSPVKQLCCLNFVSKMSFWLIVFFLFVFYCFVYTYVNNIWVTRIGLMTLEKKLNKMDLFSSARCAEVLKIAHVLGEIVK